VSVWLVLGLAVLCVARDAAAERAIVVDLVEAPFAASELATAIRVRVPVDGPRIQIRVTTTTRGVQIEAAGGVREIALLGLRGTAAARLVALAANDLLPGERPDDLPDDRPDDLAITTTLAPATAGARTAPGARIARSAWTLGALGAVASWGEPLGNLALDATRSRDRWLVALEVGGGQLVGSSVDLTMALARVSAGWHAGVIEARIGLTVAPVTVSNGTGDQTVLFGAHGSLRARLPLAGTLRAILAVGGDVFATRTSYRIASMTALTTPRFAPWLAAGVEVGL
jgi:hypothetical protein